MVHVLSCSGNPRCATFNLITFLVLEAFALNDKRHFPLAQSVSAHGQALSQRLIWSLNVYIAPSAYLLMGQRNCADWKSLWKWKWNITAQITSCINAKHVFVTVGALFNAVVADCSCKWQRQTRLLRLGHMRWSQWLQAEQKWGCSY